MIDSEKFYPFTSPNTVVNARCQIHLFLLEARMNRRSDKNPFRVMVDARGPRAPSLIRYACTVAAKGTKIYVRTGDEELAEQAEGFDTRVQCFNAPISDLVRQATPNLILVHGSEDIIHKEYHTPEVWPAIHTGTFFYHDAVMPPPLELVERYLHEDNSWYRSRFESRFPGEIAVGTFLAWYHLNMLRQVGQHTNYHMMALAWRLADETEGGGGTSAAVLHGSRVPLGGQVPEVSASLHSLSRKEGRYPGLKVSQGRKVHSRVPEEGEAPSCEPVFYDTVNPTDALAWGNVCDVAFEEIERRVKELDTPLARLAEKSRYSAAFHVRESTIMEAGLYMKLLGSLLHQMGDILPGRGPGPRSLAPRPVRSGACPSSTP